MSARIYYSAAQVTVDGKPVEPLPLPVTIEPAGHYDRRPIPSWDERLPERRFTGGSPR